MTATLVAHTVPRTRRTGLFRDLDRPADALSNVTPNWFAAVMGTGIVAVAAHGLPQQFAGLAALATVFWLLAAALLVVLVVATAAHWRRHPATARGHVADPVIGHFYGAVPMALMTVGTATLLVGPPALGAATATAIDWTLWSLGTVLGLVTAVALPVHTFTAPGRSAAFGGWLMPVVPPMVSASAGALLVPHAPAGQGRTTLLLFCYALFGAALLASLAVIVLIWLRLATDGPGPARLVPTLWIVLGPLGQSITAANLLGAAAATTLDGPSAQGLRDFGLVYGIVVWGFALLWLAVAASITLRTARAGMPFALTWWSFTFPVGTVVTGTSGLAAHTGADLFRWSAPVLFAALVVAWTVVAARTAHGALVRGYLLAPPASG